MHEGIAKRLRNVWQGFMPDPVGGSPQAATAPCRASRARALNSGSRRARVTGCTLASTRRLCMARSVWPNCRRKDSSPCSRRRLFGKAPPAARARWLRSAVRAAPSRSRRQGERTAESPRRSRSQRAPRGGRRAVSAAASSGGARVRAAAARAREAHPADAMASSGQLLWLAAPELAPLQGALDALGCAGRRSSSRRRRCCAARSPLRADASFCLRMIACCGMMRP
jgi:hypothetical protein